MAAMTSIIRYKYRADRDFESLQFEGAGCSVGELKRLIIEKSVRTGAHHPKDDYDLIISDPTTHEEYKDSAEVISRNTSVIVTRRIRGTFESLTPTSNRKPVQSFDETVNEYIRPAMAQSTTLTSSAVHIPSSVVESQSSTNVETRELSEDERIKALLQTSQSLYLPTHRSSPSYTCHNCKQPGHLRNQCPLLLQSSSAHTNGNGFPSKSDSTKFTSRQYNNRLHHRGGGHLRNEPMLRTTKGIPRDGLISIPQPIPGAFRDQYGAPVVPRQMAQLLLEKSDQKADALAQRARQFQEKGVLPSAPPPSMLPTKAADEDVPPDDLLCPLCQRVYHDAVIAPCCHNSFCDECIRTALIESEDHQCPHCRRQHVPIGQINPNLFLRKCVNSWLENRSHDSSYPYMSSSQSMSLENYSTPPTIEQTSPSISAHESADADDENAIVLPALPQKTVKTAPIVIRMQPLGRGQSPTEDEKASSNKDVKSESSITDDDDTREEIPHPKIDSTVVEDEKSIPGTPSSQLATVSTIQSLPPTTMTPSVSAQHYPAPPGVIYPPPTVPANFYPIQHNHYVPPMHHPYPIHRHALPAPPMFPVDGFHYYPQVLTAPYHQPQASTEFHLTHYESANVLSPHHPETIYAATSTSTLISHHHVTSTQAPSGLEDVVSSKHQNSMRERHQQRGKQSTSRRRSLSYSSHSDSDSRRADRRYHRHSSPSHSHRRAVVHHRADNRRATPSRDQHRRKRRSPSPRNRSRTSPVNDRRSSKHRRSSPRSHRSTGEQERRRSPRPPPTIQQSTQRTVVYLHESSSSKANSDRARDDPPVKTLASRIETVMKEKPSSSVLSNSSNKIQSIEAMSPVPKHQRKRKNREYDHGARSKKHRHHSEKKNSGAKAIVDRTLGIAPVE